MKKCFVLCMLAALLCCSAFAAESPQKPVIPADYQLSNSLPADLAAELTAYNDALRAEMDAIQAEMSHNKLEGIDDPYLSARMTQLRAELGLKSTVTIGRYTPTLDEGGESCTSGTVIGGLPYADGGNTCDNADDYDPSCIFDEGAPDVFYLYTPPVDQHVTVTTCHTATDYDTGLYILDSNGNEIACNDDAPGAPIECDLNGLNRKSLLECVELTAGETYCIGVDGFNVSCGNYLLTVEECETTCAPCPVVGFDEGEGDCYDGYVDTFNSGCNAITPNNPIPAWSSIGCNEVVCGTSGNFDIFDDTGNAFPARDTDWYLISISEPSVLRWCVTAEFAPRVAIIDLLANGCNNPVGVVELLDGDNCTATCVEACVPVGRYALFVSTVGFNDGVPCGTPYVGTVECEPCDPPPLCVPDPPLVNLNPSALPLPYYECLFICPEFPTTICIGPGLGPDQLPVATILSGCVYPDLGCDSTSCPPTSAVTNSWYYDATTGSWYLRIVAFDQAGCVCLCIEDILPVELSNFDAVAGDGEVTLSWTTASETDNDHFDIQRDGALVGRVTAENRPSGSNYTWTEYDLENGREYAYTLISVDVNGGREELATVAATPSMNNATVSEYALHQNYPNPFNPETSIMFDLADAGDVTLVVYNSLGQEVATLISSSLEAGRHSVSFSANDLTSGLYFYRLTAGDFTAIRKMVLMK